MKRKYLKSIILYILLAAFLVSGILGVKAENALSVDYKYYFVKLSDVEKTLPSIVNDANWRSWISVTEAKKGIHIDWKAAVKNVRVASPLELSLDGTHAVFSDLKTGSGGCMLGFTISSRAAFGDYITNPAANPLAALPMVLALNTKDGTVTSFAAKSINLESTNVIKKQVYQSENLKTENLSGKEFGLSFDIVSGDSPNNYMWQVTLAGESFTLPHSDMIDASSSLDINSCYMTVNAWNEAGTNTMSLNWQSLHGGKLTCADKKESKSLLQGADALIKRISAITSVKPSVGKEIKSIRKTYDAMPDNQKFFIENYESFVRKENAYGVVKKIAEIKSVTANSQEVFSEIDKAYSALTDTEKKLVTNYKDYTALKKKYFKILMNDLYNQKDYKINTLTGEPEIIEENETVTETVDKTVDVDGGTTTKTITNHVNITGKNGTQFLWIPITAASVLLAGMATWFLIVFIKRKRAGK